MRRSILAACLITILSSYNNGDPVAKLQCKSTSGRTSFAATLPGCDYLEKAELIIDGVKQSFDSKHHKANIVFDPKNKVFTVYLESIETVPSTYKFLKFWAIPSSFKLISSERGPGSQFHEIYEFKGQLYGTEPRKDKKNNNTPVVELTCTLDYEL